MTFTWRSRERLLDELVLGEVGDPRRAQPRGDGVRVLGDDQTGPFAASRSASWRNPALSRSAFRSSLTVFWDTAFPLTENRGDVGRPAAHGPDHDRGDETTSPASDAQLSLHGAGEPTGAASSGGINGLQQRDQCRGRLRGWYPQRHQHLLGARLGPRRQPPEAHLLRLPQVEAPDAGLAPPLGTVTLRIPRRTHSARSRAAASSASAGGGGGP